ncbi:unnamed protein product [Tuber aestivum]|uniref:Uncharacterized protein n=1 Tax=Tuber aestivum TaxID=59557 RepID=A0A292Q923_9PEZI|nr:unnamed protein product [Tuber aestivum]
MGEGIEGFSDAEENLEGASFMDTLKAYTEDLEAPVPPYEEYSPTPLHTSSPLSVTHSSGGSYVTSEPSDHGESDYLEDEGGGDSGSEELSSAPPTPSTPSSEDEFWDPAPVPNDSRHSTPKANSNTHLPTPSTSTRKCKNKEKPPSPSCFISLLSSSSSGSPCLSSSEDEVTIIRSRALPSQPLKRKFLDSIEPRKKVNRMVMERESDREWSVRDRGVLAEAMQDGMNFNRVAGILGREVDEDKMIPSLTKSVFRMFTRVIAGILLHAPKPRDKATQTEQSFGDGTASTPHLEQGNG